MLYRCLNTTIFIVFQVTVYPYLDKFGCSTNTSLLIFLLIIINIWTFQITKHQLFNTKHCTNIHISVSVKLLIVVYCNSHSQQLQWLFISMAAIYQQFNSTWNSYFWHFHHNFRYVTLWQTLHFLTYHSLRKSCPLLMCTRLNRGRICFLHSSSMNDNGRHISLKT